MKRLFPHRCDLTRDNFCEFFPSLSSGFCKATILLMLTILAAPAGHAIIFFGKRVASQGPCELKSVWFEERKVQTLEQWNGKIPWSTMTPYVTTDRSPSISIKVADLKSSCDYFSHLNKQDPDKPVIPLWSDYSRYDSILTFQLTLLFLQMTD